VSNAQGRRVWSLARTSLNVRVKCQRSRSPGTKKRAVHSHYPRQQRNGTHSLQIMTVSSRRDHSVAAWAVISEACVRFVLGKTSLALGFIFIRHDVCREQQNTKKTTKLLQNNKVISRILYSFRSNERTAELWVGCILRRIFKLLVPGRVMTESTVRPGRVTGVSEP